MIRPLIAGNWKMNKVPTEAATWLGDLKEKLKQTDAGHADILLCVPATHLGAMVAAQGFLALGGQDMSQHESGAYTGEISAAMLKDAGASYVIVGHSERREYHKEDDALLNAKVKKALEHNLIPILCVGESEAQRDAGKAKDVVIAQLKADLEGISFASADDLVIAYEPIWAIGTGKTATADDAQEMCAAIRQTLAELYPDQASRIRILYGGSMKPSNAQELLSKADINGGLIGGASLKTDDLLALVAAAK
ncbi:MAG: triose-phosphate isomerase [Trueperaceae bacterium]|nr:triose-phosphate isomerase [Trueperaceae bacterium]